MLTRSISVLVVTVLTLTLVGCNRGVEKTEGSLPRGVVARVAEQDIGQAQLDLRARVFELFFQQSMAAPQTREQLLDQLIEQKLLVMEAQKQNATLEETKLASETQLFMTSLEERHQGPEALRKKMKELKLTTDDIRNFLSDFLLAQKMVESLKASTTLGDEEVKQFYERNKSGLYTFTEDVVRARHILVPADKEQKAQELAQRAKGGEDFSKLARDYSTDPGSGRVGGDLGYFRKVDMVPEFAEIAFALKPGEVGGPVRSQFGWHVIKVDDRRPPGAIPFELTKTDIMNKLLPSKQDEAVSQWLNGSKQAAAIEKAEFNAEPAKK